MRAPRYVYVGLSYPGNVPVEPNVAGVDAVVNSESQDWMRYNWLSYILWTPSDCEIIVRKIRRVPGMQDFCVLAVALNFEDCFGFLPPWLWDWLGKARGQYPRVQFETPTPE
jgi:hypothetical protein